jgi:thioredoxin 2
MSHTYAACKNCHSINRIQIEKAKDAVCGRCKSAIAFHGLVSEANTDEFHKIIRSSDKPVVVDFWASWCGPCKMYGPEFEKASLKNHNAVFLKINTEEENQLAGQLGIRGIPTTVIFRDGKESFRQSGAMDADTLNRLITP